MLMMMANSDGAGNGCNDKTGGNGSNDTMDSDDSSGNDHTNENLLTMSPFPNQGKP